MHPITLLLTQLQHRERPLQTSTRLPYNTQRQTHRRPMRTHQIRFIHNVKQRRHQQKTNNEPRFQLLRKQQFHPPRGHRLLPSTNQTPLHRRQLNQSSQHAIKRRQRKTSHSSRHHRESHPTLNNSPSFSPHTQGPTTYNRSQQDPQGHPPPQRLHRQVTTHHVNTQQGNHGRQRSTPRSHPMQGQQQVPHLRRPLPISQANQQQVRPQGPHPSKRPLPLHATKKTSNNGHTTRASNNHNRTTQPTKQEQHKRQHQGQLLNRPISHPPLNHVPTLNIRGINFSLTITKQHLCLLQSKDHRTQSQSNHETLQHNTKSDHQRNLPHTQLSTHNNVRTTKQEGPRDRTKESHHQHHSTQPFQASRSTRFPRVRATKEVLPLT